MIPHWLKKTLSTGADDPGMTKMSEAIMESKGNCFSTDSQNSSGSIKSSSSCCSALYFSISSSSFEVEPVAEAVGTSFFLAITAARCLKLFLGGSLSSAGCSSVCPGSAVRSDDFHVSLKIKFFASSICSEACNNLYLGSKKVATT